TLFMRCGSPSASQSRCFRRGATRRAAYPVATTLGGVAPTTAPIPEEHVRDGRAGRKPIPTRRVLEAVLWILNTGAQWHMLPQSYPNYKTVHRRFQNWCHNAVA